jgi:uncharacterized protein (TIGR00730 family)
MWNSKPVVAIFGSSQVIEGDGEYEQARLLGRLLARAGFAICNGGYAGAMEASARGASEMEGASIGFTLRTFGRKSGNPFLTREIESDTLFERLSHFVELAEAFVALPGGIGTLAELFTIWNMLQIRQFAPRPFILLGERWPAVIDHLHQNMEIRGKDLEFLQMIASPEEAVEKLKSQLKR